MGGLVDWRFYNFINSKYHNVVPQAKSFKSALGCVITLAAIFLYLYFAYFNLYFHGCYLPVNAKTCLHRIPKQFLQFHFFLCVRKNDPIHMYVINGV